jgi:hypothetical protein
MKFEYRSIILGTTYCPEYEFKFSITEDEARRVSHKYGYTTNWVGETFEYTKNIKDYQVWAALKVIQDVSTDIQKVDLGIDYKAKYEELVELLQPYKIEDDMPPSTTLKMILKYNKL